MTVGIGAILLGVLWLCCEAYCGGWWNVVDTVAYWLHRYAVNGRRLHQQRTAFVSERWIRSLEE